MIEFPEVFIVPIYFLVPPSENVICSHSFKAPYVAEGSHQPLKKKRDRIQSERDRE